MASDAEEFDRNEAVEVDVMLQGKKGVILAGVEKEIPQV